MMATWQRWLCLVLLFADKRATGAPVALLYISRELPTEKLELSEDNFTNVIKTTKPIKFIIHGWGESSERPYFQQITREYLTQDDVQIVQVDWGTLAGKTYFQSADNTKTVGNYIAELLIKLSKAADNDIFPMVHIIGHSLGAHAAGHVGKTTRKKIGKIPGRITGLDPAGPHFDVVSSERLTSDDASFVDITHTDGNYFGLYDAVGHVDFYPNGGHRPQPGCEPFNFEIVEMLQLDPSHIGFCSHIKSYAYFIESINNRTDLATKCRSYEDFKRGVCDSNQQIVYGERVNVDPDSFGRYYFDVTGPERKLLGVISNGADKVVEVTKDILDTLLKRN